MPGWLQGLQSNQLNKLDEDQLREVLSAGIRLSQVQRQGLHADHRLLVSEQQSDDHDPDPAPPYNFLPRYEDLYPSTDSENLAPATTVEPLPPE